jgi:N-dimethylarginine dimethylaminohydrolase
MEMNFLMCAPPSDEVVFKTELSRQWDRLVETLQCAGDVRIVYPETPGVTPNCMYAGHAALVSGKLALVSTYRDRSRRHEEAFYRTWFARNGYAPLALSDVSFEGAADALFDRHSPLVYVGCSTRLERGVVPELAATIGVRALALELVSAEFKTLDSVLCPLGSGHVIVYFDALSTDSERTIRRAVDADRIIAIERDDARALACSAIEVGDTVVLHDASRRLRERLLAAGYKTFATDLSAFHRRGHSAKSLALRLKDGPAFSLAA